MTADDLAALAGVAEDLELHQLGVLLGRGVELVTDTAGLVVRPPDVEAGRGLLGRELAHGQTALHAGEPDVDALGFEQVGLRRAHDELDLAPTLDLTLTGHVQALLGDDRQLRRL